MPNDKPYLRCLSLIDGKGGTLGLVLQEVLMGGVHGRCLWKVFAKGFVKGFVKGVREGVRKGFVDIAVLIEERTL